MSTGSKRLSSAILLAIGIILGLVILSLALAVAMIGAQVGSEPIILEIREDGNGVWYTDPVKLKSDYVPTDKAYEKVLKRLIRGMRMVEGFYDANEELVLNALFSSTENASRLLQEKLEQQNPFDLAGTIRIDVPEDSIDIEKISQGRWKASWRERTYDSSGNKTMEADYEGVFHTTLREVEDTGLEPNPKEYNPLGIMVYDYDIDLLRKLM